MNEWMGKCMDPGLPVLATNFWCDLVKSLSSTTSSFSCHVNTNTKHHTSSITCVVSQDSSMYFFFSPKSTLQTKWYRRPHLASGIYDSASDWRKYETSTFDGCYRSWKEHEKNSGNSYYSHLWMATGCQVPGWVPYMSSLTYSSSNFSIWILLSQFHKWAYWCSGS